MPRKIKLEIREAVPEDNLELQKVQARCPQGASQNLSTVNTPDFFTRAKIFADNKVFVITHKNKIIGSAACAVHDAMVNGTLVKVGYGFQAFVDPHYRGKGIAGQLHQVREDYMRKQGAILGYTLILEKNFSSMRYIERQGFQQYRTLIMPSIIVNHDMEVGRSSIIRPVTAKDLATVADLINRTWQDYELYEPLTAQSLADLVKRTPVYSFKDIYVLEENGMILACLGFWDWSRVMSCLMNIARLFRPLPRGPRVGDELKQIVLTPIGFSDTEHMGMLLRYINNQAFARGIQQIDCVCEKNHPLLDSFKGFVRIDSEIHVFYKPFQDGLALTDQPVYVGGLNL